MLAVRQAKDVDTLPNLVSTLKEWRKNPKASSEMHAVSIPLEQLDLISSKRPEADRVYNSHGERFVIVLDEDSIRNASEYLTTYGKWPDGRTLSKQDVHIPDTSDAQDAVDGLRDAFLFAKKLGYNGAVFVTGNADEKPLFMIKHVPNSQVITATGQDVESVVNQQRPTGFD